MGLLISTMRAVLAIALALLVGFWALPGLMSDLGPGETEALRLIYLIAVYLVGGLLVGLLAGRLWWLAALCGWPPALRAANLALHSLHGGPGGLVDTEAATQFVVVASLSLMGAFAGRVLLPRIAARIRAVAGD